MDTKKQTENREGFILGFGLCEEWATHNKGNNISNNQSNPNISNNQSNNPDNSNNSTNISNSNKSNNISNPNKSNKILSNSENVIRIIKPIFCPLCNEEIMKDDDLHICSNNIPKKVKSVSNGLNNAKMGYSNSDIEKENIEYEQEITDSNISNILNYIPRSQKIKKEVKKWII